MDFVIWLICGCAIIAGVALFILAMCDAASDADDQMEIDYRKFNEKKKGENGMNKCGDNCKPSCNFCMYSKHGKIETDGTNKPIGCTKNLDEEHQRLAIANLSCDDFDCYEADRKYVSED